MARTRTTVTAPTLIFDDFELGKAGGAWFITGFLRDRPRIVLRVKIIKEFGVGDPFNVCCEVRRPGCTEFEAVGSFADMDQMAFLDSCLYDLPEVWRGAFAEMFRRLSYILERADLAPCDAERYAAEPWSSRDYCLFGPADDLPHRR